MRVATADVVVANLPPQTVRAMTIMNFAERDQAGHHPDHGNCVRRAGPWSYCVGFDGVAEVMSGAGLHDGKAIRRTGQR